MTRYNETSRELETKALMEHPVLIGPVAAMRYGEEKAWFSHETGFEGLHSYSDLKEYFATEPDLADMREAGSTVDDWIADIERMGIIKPVPHVDLEYDDIGDRPLPSREGTLVLTGREAMSEVYRDWRDFGAGMSLDEFAQGDIDTFRLDLDGFWEVDSQMNVVNYIGHEQSDARQDRTAEFIERLKTTVKASYKEAVSALMDEGAELAAKNEPFEAAKTYLAASHLETQVLEEGILDELVAMTALDALDAHLDQNLVDGHVMDMLVRNAREHAAADIDYFQDEFASRSCEDFNIDIPLDELKRTDEREGIASLTQQASEAAGIVNSIHGTDARDIAENRQR